MLPQTVQVRDTEVLWVIAIAMSVCISQPWATMAWPDAAAAAMLRSTHLRCNS